MRYRRKKAASVHQLAVDPEFQDVGIGTRLLQVAETWAREHGYRELALDTPQPACHLVKYYEHHGYRRVETVGFQGKVYRSVVMSKPVTGRRANTFSRPRTAMPAQRVTLHLTVDPSMAARLRSAATSICGEALDFLRIEPVVHLPRVECHLCLNSAGFESASDAIIRTMTAAHAGQPA
jgi:tRNA(Met) C34 N-acetyltransferase TmcA